MKKVRQYRLPEGTVAMLDHMHRATGLSREELVALSVVHYAAAHPPPPPRSIVDIELERAQLPLRMRQIVEERYGK